jgi:hypothetical protein
MADRHSLIYQLGYWISRATILEWQLEDVMAETIRPVGEYDDLDELKAQLTAFIHKEGQGGRHLPIALSHLEEMMLMLRFHREHRDA